MISIDRGAFANCSKLTTVNIPDDVAHISGDAFYSTPWLENFIEAHSKTDDFVILGDTLLHSGTQTSGDIVIPDGITVIGDGAFSDCSGITSITLPDSVTSMGLSPFKDIPLIIFDGTAGGYTYPNWGAKKIMKSDGTILYDSATGYDSSSDD